jgi:NADH:ubiquinone oxidoreductase subunit 5 (subunit L)/multisubunit Na+/H+ antiporter MnhA subunit
MERSARAVGAAAVATAVMATVAVLVVWRSGGGGFDVAWLPSWGARLAFRLDGLGALYALLATGIGVAVFTYATQPLQSLLLMASGRLRGLTAAQGTLLMSVAHSDDGIGL